MAGVFKRGETWWIRYSFAGRQIRRSAQTKNKKTAEALLAKVRAELHSGVHFPEARSAELTFGQLAERWMDHASRNKRSAASDVARLGRLVTFFGEARSVSNILPADVRELTRALQDEPSRKGGTLSAQSVNHHLTLLKAALAMAEADGYLVRAGKVKLVRTRSERDRIATDEEITQLTKAASPPLALTITLCHLTAMRLAEVAGLRWSQIDLKEGVVRLAQADTKTGKARVVPLPREAVEALRAWPRRLDGRVFDPGWTSSNVSPQFTRLCRKVGIEDLRLHDLRHTAATRLRRVGVDVVTIGAILGHRTLDMVKRYQTISADDLKAAVAKVSSTRSRRR